MFALDLLRVPLARVMLVGRCCQISRQNLPSPQYKVVPMAIVLLFVVAAEQCGASPDSTLYTARTRVLLPSLAAT